MIEPTYVKTDPEPDSTDDESKKKLFKECAKKKFI
jgi:hypothetical protein